MTTHTRPRNLMGASLEEIGGLLAGLGEPSFRARQVHHWLYRRLALSFEEMSDLPKKLREKLPEVAFLAIPKIIDKVTAPDGTTKYALAMEDGVTVEAVAIPMNGHMTLCLSSQAGCAVGCRFCVTGALGSGRNLRAYEIFGEYSLLMRDLGLVGSGVNVVFMGMGEPLLNFPEVVGSLNLLRETVSFKRITVSTAGIVPKIRQLGTLPRRPNLAVSVNATTDQQRAWLMPGAGRWSLAELLAALQSYPLERGRRITIEYVLIEGVNDSREDAARLAELLAGLRVKVNLIPFNPDPVFLPSFQPPPEAGVDAFAGYLAARGFNVTVRRSKGWSVAAACGQLRGQLWSGARG